MRFGSKAAMLTVGVQGQDPILHPHTGSVIGHKKEISAEFFVTGPEFIPKDEHGDPIAHDMDGSPFATANVRGHYWDSNAAQEANGWTDEEREAAEAQVLYFCRTQPALVWKLEDPVLSAPWPTFDDQTDKVAVSFAVEAGLAKEALAYARQQKRAGVVKALEAIFREQEESVQAEQALTLG
jgi:hypothetical protein